MAKLSLVMGRITRFDSGISILKNRLIRLPVNTGGIYSIAISPDGQTLVSGGVDQVLKIWNLHTGKLVRTLSGHSYSVNSVVISPNGQLLASGGYDGISKFGSWQPENGYGFFQVIRVL